MTFTLACSLSNFGCSSTLRVASSKPASGGRAKVTKREGEALSVLDDKCLLADSNQIVFEAPPFYTRAASSIVHDA